MLKSIIFWMFPMLSDSGVKKEPTVISLPIPGVAEAYREMKNRIAKEDEELYDQGYTHVMRNACGEVICLYKET